MSIQAIAKLITAIGLFFLGVLIGYRIESWHSDALLKAKDDALLVLQQKAYEEAQATAKGYETQRQNNQQTIEQLQKAVRTQHAKNPGAICHIDPASLQSIGAAIQSGTR